MSVSDIIICIIVLAILIFVSAKLAKILNKIYNINDEDEDEIDG
jgi:hypothetical protein